MVINKSCKDSCSCSWKKIILSSRQHETFKGSKYNTSTAWPSLYCCCLALAHAQMLTVGTKEVRKLLLLGLGISTLRQWQQLEKECCSRCLPWGLANICRFKKWHKESRDSCDGFIVLLFVCMFLYRLELVLTDNQMISVSTEVTLNWFIFFQVSLMQHSELVIAGVWALLWKNVIKYLVHCRMHLLQIRIDFSFLQRALQCYSELLIFYFPSL